MTVPFTKKPINCCLLSCARLVKLAEARLPTWWKDYALDSRGVDPFRPEAISPSGRVDRLVDQWKRFAPDRPELAAAVQRYMNDVVRPCLDRVPAGLNLLTHPQFADIQICLENYLGRAIREQATHAIRHAFLFDSALFEVVNGCFYNPAAVPLGGPAR